MAILWYQRTGEYEAGNANALEGYNRQSEKNRETNVTGPYYQMKKSTYPENVLNIADNKKIYKAQYQNQLAQAKNAKRCTKSITKFQKI